MKWYDIIARLCLAIVIGGVVGYEREFKNRPAGFRTHILVCVGACIASMIELNIAYITMSQIAASNLPYVSHVEYDISRIDAQVVTGVGFLGAGTIIHEKGSIKGLTTAATIWAVACIGLAVGFGYYILSISAAFAVIIVVVGLKTFEDRFIEKGKFVKLEIQYYERKEFIEQLQKYFKDKNIKVKSIDFLKKNDGDEYLTCICTVFISRKLNSDDLVYCLGNYKQIKKITLQNM